MTGFCQLQLGFVGFVSPSEPLTYVLPELHLTDSLVWNMTREVVRKALEQKPFRRFSVRLTDRRLVQIKGENTAAVHPRGNTMIVSRKRADIGSSILP